MRNNDSGNQRRRSQYGRQRDSESQNDNRRAYYAANSTSRSARSSRNDYPSTSNGSYRRTGSPTRFDENRRSETKTVSKNRYRSYETRASDTSSTNRSHAASSHSQSRRTQRAHDDRIRNVSSSRSNAMRDRDQKNRRGYDRSDQSKRSKQQTRGDLTFFDVVKKILIGVAKILKVVGLAIFHGFKWIWAKSRIAAVVVGLVAVFAIGSLVDNIAMAGKIYDGVKVGNIDVSGMTVSQAQTAIEDAYASKLAETQLYIFASDEAMSETDIEMTKNEQDALAEQLSVEQAQKNKVLWIENSETLGATLPSQTLAQAAYQIGRDGAFFDRLGAKMNGYEIAPYADYNELSFEKLINDIDKTIGDPVVQYGLAVEDGSAYITDGHDGYMVDQQDFTKILNDAFFENDDTEIQFVAHVVYVPLTIDADNAQRTADAVNEAIADGASFAFEDQSAFADSSELGSWIKTREEKRGNDWYLKPCIDEEKTISFLTDTMNMKGSDSQIAVNFIVEDDNVQVDPTTDITIPNVGSALESLDHALFSNFDNTGQFKLQGSQFDIPISIQTTSDRLSLEEALAFGVVSNFSSFTTQFVGNNATENRTYNIHKAADLINNSIVPADGGLWSFNETAGDCNAAAGFKDANVVSGDEMVQEAGGGVCQVATTVFNAVYDSGLPIKERHNHSIASASYPAGKDAAVAYPTLDFVWQNNTISEILLTTSYTANSITVNLIGVDPKLTVETNTGEWQEGEKYKVKYEIDETMMANRSYKKTNGFDGSSITVVRTVTDENGEVVEQNTFYSLYSPMNEIIVVGKDSDMDAMRNKYEKKDETDRDS